MNITQRSVVNRMKADQVLLEEEIERAKMAKDFDLAALLVMVKLDQQLFMALLGNADLTNPVIKELFSKTTLEDDT